MSLKVMVCSASLKMFRTWFGVWPSTLIPLTSITWEAMAVMLMISMEIEMFGFLLETFY